MSRVSFDEVAAILDAAGVNAAGRELIRRWLASDKPPPPSRRSNGAVSVTGQFPSVKTGWSQPFASDTLELPVCIHYEAKRSVKFYLMQPLSLVVPYTDPNARKTKNTFKMDPDVFLIEGEVDENGAIIDAFVGFEDLSLEERLTRRAAEQPFRYTRDENDGWSSPNAEAFMRAKYGFGYRVKTRDHLPKILTLNYDDVQYCIDDPYPVEPDVRRAVREFVEAHPGKLGRDLHKAVPALNADAVRQLSVDGGLAFPWETELLSHWEQVHFYPDAALCRAMTDRPRQVKADIGDLLLEPFLEFEFCEHNWTLLSVEGDKCRAQPHDGGRSQLLSRGELEDAFIAGELKVVRSFEQQSYDFLANTSPKTQARWAYNYDTYVRPYLEGKALPPHASRRTARRIQHNVRICQIERRQVEEAAMPNFASCGHGGERISGERLTYLERGLQYAVATEQTTPSGKRRRKRRSNKIHGLKKAWEMYRDDCEKVGKNPDGTWKMPPVALGTYKRYLRRRVSIEQETRIQKGRKAANAVMGRLPDHSPLAKAIRAFHKVHIDHVRLDFEVMDSESGEPIGMPWLTLAIDEYSGTVLACTVLFDPPSRASAQAIVRAIVERWHRLPDYFVLDHAGEWKSEYFEQALNIFKVKLMRREASSPHFGGLIERTALRLHQEYIDHLDGATKLRKKPRSMDREMDPLHFADWTFAEIDEGLEEYFFTIYNCVAHTGHPGSPEQILRRSLLRTGEHRRPVRPDAAFYALSAANTKRGWSLVGPQGLNILGSTYWDERLRAYRNQRVWTRYDLLTRAVAFAYLDHEWVMIPATWLDELEGVTERERRRAAVEFAQRYRRRPEPRELIAFIKRTLLTEEGKRERQHRLRAKEQRNRLRDKRHSLGAPQKVRRKVKRVDPGSVPVFAVETVS